MYVAISVNDIISNHNRILHYRAIYAVLYCQEQSFFWYGREVGGRAGINHGKEKYDVSTSSSVYLIHAGEVVGEFDFSPAAAPAKLLDLFFLPSSLVITL